MKNVCHLAAAALSSAVLLAPLSANAQAADKWEVGAAIYVYLPTIGAKTMFPPSGNGGGVSVDANTDCTPDFESPTSTYTRSANTPQRHRLGTK